MAKTFDDGIKPVTFIAGEDLTAKQYYAVRAGSIVDEVLVATGGSNPAPIGIIQEGASVGYPVSVKCVGFTLARVSACNYAGTAACDVDQGHYLAAGEDGLLYYSGGTAPNARAFGDIVTGSAIINVYFLGFGAASGMPVS